MESGQAKFEGWAVVEMMGHQREIGFVTTEYFGGAAMFRVDAPEIPERDFELKRPEYDHERGRMIPAGSKVKRPGIPAKSRLVSPGALYAITPCTEDTARKAIDEMVTRRLIVLEINEQPTRVLTAGSDEGWLSDACSSLRCDECNDGDCGCDCHVDLEDEAI